MLHLGDFPIRFTSGALASLLVARDGTFHAGCVYPLPGALGRDSPSFLSSVFYIFPLSDLSI